MGTSVYQSLLACLENASHIKVADFVCFFQAEDGIRDYKVTGVQTCALPISLVSIQDAEADVSMSDLSVSDIEADAQGSQGDEYGGLSFHASTSRQKRRRIHLERSEERRVGKECRSRWSPYH